ncbi:MAG: hypothetical protein HQL36_10050, partial [Alphaproteobacteria bacterium]|nr:hypothetical protein [Alphaproteobacteria bacterium]
MADEKVGPSAPIVSVRPGRNRLTEEDNRGLFASKLKRHHGGGEGGDSGAG